MARRRWLTIVFLALAMTRSSWRIARADDEPLPPDTCVVEFTLPSAATLHVGKTDYGTKRKLTYRRLAADQRYEIEATVHFASGREIDRRLLLSGGQYVRLAFTDPAEERHETQIIQRGHVEHVNSIAFSADGHYCVTGSADKTALVWDVNDDWTVIRQLDGHDEYVTSTAISPDGRFVLAASWNGRLILYDRESGKPLREPEITGLNPMCVGFSPNGKLMLCGSTDGSVIVWDVASGRRLRTLKAPVGGIYYAQFSPDSRRVLSVGGLYRKDKDGPLGEAVLWDLGSGRIVHQFAGHKWIVKAAAFSPDGRWIVTGSSESKLQLWDAQSGALVRSLEGHQGQIIAAAFSPDSRRLVTVGGSDEEAEVFFWNPENGELLSSGAGHWDTVNDVAFHPSGRFVATAGTDGLIMLWDPETGAVISTLGYQSQGAQNVVLTEDRFQLVTESADLTTPLVWEAATGRPFRKFVGHTDEINATAISPDGRLLLTGGDEKTTLWDIGSGEVRHALEGHTHIVFSVAFSPNGKLAASGTGIPKGKDEAELFVWDTSTGKLRRRFSGQTSLVNSLAFGPAGRMLLVGGLDGRATLWDVNRGRKLGTFAGHDDWITAVAISPDGGRAVTASRDGVIKLWSIRQGSELATWRGHEKKVTSVAFSPDGKLVASGSLDGRLIVWDVDTGRKLRAFAHRLQINCVTFGPNARLALAGFWDGSVSICDVASGAKVARLLTLEDGQTWLCTTPEGLYDGSYWGRLKVSWAVTGSETLLHAPALEDRYHWPGLLEELLSGKRPLPRAANQGSAVDELEIHPLAAVAASPVSTEESQLPALLPDNKCVLQLKLPTGSKVVLGNHSYGAVTGLEFLGMQPGRRYEIDLNVEIEGSPSQKRHLLLEGGRRVRLAVDDPRQVRPEMVLQTAHRGGVHWVAISPNGKYAVTSSEDETALLWDLKSGKTLRVFSDQTSSLSEVVFSPDGKQILTASFDGTAILYDITAGNMVHTFADHFGKVVSCTFSHDGHYLATGSDDGTAILYDARSGRRVRTFRAPEGEVWVVRFSPDDRYFITAGGLLDDTTIENPSVAKLLSRTMGELVVWDMETGQQVLNFQEHKQPVSDVDFSPDGKLVVSADQDGRALIWELKTGKVARTLHGERGPINSVDFSPDGRYLVTGGGPEVPQTSNDDPRQSAELVLWDAATGSRIREFRGHEEAVLAVAISPDGRYLLSGSQDGAAILWEIESGSEVRRYKGYAGYVAHVTIDSRRFELLVQNNDGKQIALWDANSGQRLQDLKSQDGRFNCVDISPDGSHIATGTREGKVTIWDATTGKSLLNFQAHPHLVADLRFSPDGRVLATAGGKYWTVASEMVPCQIFLWDTQTGRRLKAFSGHQGPLGGIAFSADGRYLVSGGDDQLVIVWDLKSGRSLHILRGHSTEVSAIAISPDGKHLLSGDEAGLIVEWDLQTGRKLRNLTEHSGHIYFIGFSADGQQMLTGAGDRMAILWDVNSGRAIRRFACDDHVTFVRLSDDGARLLTGLYDATATVWDVASGSKLAKVELLADASQWVVVTPEGLFDGSQQGRQRVSWRIGDQLSVVPVDRFFQDFYRPGLLNEVFSGLRPLPETKLGQSLPPRLRLLSPESGPIDKRQVTIHVEAHDRGGGISRLAIYQNGARVLAPGKRESHDGTLRQTFQVSLIEGENRFRITATNDDGSWEAEPAELMLQYEQPLTKSDLHVLAIGINNYADGNLRLSFAANDARALAELFRRRGKALYKNVHVTELLDQHATHDAIRDAIRRTAAATKPQDTLVVFLAGHGIMVGQRYYFVPYEFRHKQARLDDDLRQQGFPADELAVLLASAGALKRLFILDTCASGGALSAGFQGRSGFALRGAIERLSRTQGVFTIAASAASEEAQESGKLGHGVLTYTLLAGLNDVDRGPLESTPVHSGRQDRVVDVLSWFSYAAGQVPRLTQQLFGVAQDVHTSTQGMTFPVLPLDD